MKLHTIENEFLRATVSDTGAELISVFDKEKNTERIWIGDPAVWNRHAPILFPFVGKVKDGKYRVGDREYEMKTQHGFARDMVFACPEETETSVAHCLSDTEGTREIYPWEFNLTVIHRLEGKRLFITWQIENRSGERMYYSIGGHPGFMMPEGIRKEDCCILFPGVETLRYRSADKAGFVLPEEKTLRLKDACATYQPDIPDTWIFEDGQVKKVGILLPDGKPWVMLQCDAFPMLAVWANPQGPFICLEPWFGRTDDVNFRGTIDQKKDMQSLGQGEKRETGYSIEFI